MQTTGGGYLDNTSGQGPTAGVPSEIRGFNWGALLLNWIWAIFNTTCGMAVLSFVLAFVPLVNLAWAIYLGVRGNEWAWQNKRWNSIEHFQRTQRTWMIAGIIVFAASILLGCVCGALSGFLGAMDNATTTGR